MHTSLSANCFEQSSKHFSKMRISIETFSWPVTLIYVPFLDLGLAGAGDCTGVVLLPGVVSMGLGFVSSSTYSLFGVLTAAESTLGNSSFTLPGSCFICTMEDITNCQLQIWSK